MSDKKLIINAEKCVHCGLCIQDCIASCLKFDDNKTPEFRPNGEKFCIKCQHCFAICPTGALSILDKNPDESELVLEKYNFDEVLNLMKSRRSFRHYKKENLDKKTLEKLKNMLNFVPTGVNNHSLHFSFIDEIEVMDEFRATVNSKLVHALTKTPLKIIAKKFERYKNAILRGDDVLFRGAPHLVVVATPIDAPCAEIDPVIALSYFELYAQSLGVATLWCGLAEFCLKMFPELSEQLGIPENYKASYVMLFGPAKIKYSRSTQPEPFSMVSVKKDFAEKKVSLRQKFKRFLWNSK